jgi:transposase-like protein
MSAMPDPSPPPVCPFCQKGPVTTTSKQQNEATYWRCHACGQIWNPGRMAAIQKQRRW